MPSCSHAVLPSCRLAIMQSCSHKILRTPQLPYSLDLPTSDPPTLVRLLADQTFRPSSSSWRIKPSWSS